MPDGDHVLRAQRVFGDGRHQRRVDAAAQCHQNLCESRICAHNRACPEPAHGKPPRCRPHPGRALEARQTGRPAPGPPRTRLPVQSARRAHSRASEEPSKIRLSLPPTWLDISTGMPSRRAIAASISRRMARLPCQKGDEDRLICTAGLLAHQLFHGIDRIQPPRPEVLVVPGVFADGNRQPHSVQFHHLLRSRRGKVPLLVEDVVERQQALVLFQQQASSIQQNAGIYGWFSRLTLRRKRHACQHCGRQLARCRGQLIHS